VDLTCFDDGMARIEADLPLILSGLASAGGDTPVIGMSYYDPFLAAWLLGPSGRAEATTSIGLAQDLNTVLADDYGASATADVQGVFKTADTARHGHYAGETVPVDVARICAWTHMCAEGDIHADDVGHARIARAFEEVLRTVLAADTSAGHARRP
jgi:hypothetical protein